MNIDIYAIDELEADNLLTLCKTIKYTNKMGNREIAQFGVDYMYSGKLHKGQPIPEWLDKILKDVSELVGINFNGILVNKYPAGILTGIGFHKDNEPELGENPIVVSLSLGETDEFIIRNSTHTHTIELEHGNVLVMGKDIQVNYYHGIHKKIRKQDRISLTFRKFNINQ